MKHRLVALALVCLLFAALLQTIVAALIPVTWVIARKTTVRTNGVHMIATGWHRATTGRW